jgi:hypothetical protein
MKSTRVTFLFGAGASYGAGHTLPTGTPLGEKLYDALASEYPGTWGPTSLIGRRYADGLRANFEQTFTDEISRWIPAIDVVDAFCDVARIFAKFSLDGTGDDLYTRLLAFLKSRDLLATATFASLNYECLFELAAAGLGLCVNYFARTEDPSALQVLKLHGSCNFITDDLSQWRAHLTNPGSFLGCRINALSPRNLQKVLDSKFRERAYNCYFYPILSLYAVGKNTHLAPEKIEEFRNAWSEEAAQATHLVVIGVRFNSRDSHITGPVTHSQAQTVLYVGSSQDFEQWHSINPDFQHLGERLEDCLGRLCDGLL